MIVSPNETVASCHGSPVASSCSIVLLGKVGTGKSATGNTLLERKNYFPSKKRSKAVTTKISKGAVNVNGRELVVYDTPGFCDPDCSDEVIHEKIKTVIDETSSNPRVFLLVVKIDRFTAEEQSVVREVESILGSTLLENTIILFTRGDELEDQSIEDFIGDDNDLTITMEKYGTRYHVFNNKIDDPEQVKSLVDKIEHFSQTPNPSCGPRIKPQTPLKRRLILIGKTGVGKSATGNTILGSDHFKSEQCMASVTQRTQVGHGVVCDRDVCVVDTPGLFDSNQTVDKLAEEFAESVMSCEPGPHAFLIVMPINNRFTQHEREAIDILDKVFGPHMAEHAIIAFTFGDLLVKGNSVEKMIAQSPDLSRLVKQCGGRYQLINNNNRCKNNKHQVEELMGRIDKMLEMNGGSYYTSEMFIQATEVAKEEEERKQKEQESLKMQADEKQRSLEQHHQNELARVKREAEQQNTIDQEKLQQRIHELEHLKLEMEKKQEEEHRSQNQPNIQRENEERLVQEAPNQNPSNDPNPDSASTHRKKWLTQRIRKILIYLGIGAVVGAAAVGLAVAVGVAVVGAVVGVGVGVGVGAGLGALGGAGVGAGVGAVIGEFTGKDPKKDN